MGSDKSLKGVLGPDFDSYFLRPSAIIKRRERSRPGEESILLVAEDHRKAGLIGGKAESLPSIETAFLRIAEIGTERMRNAINNYPASGNKEQMRFLDHKDFTNSGKVAVMREIYQESQILPSLQLFEELSIRESSLPKEEKRFIRDIRAVVNQVAGYTHAEGNLLINQIAPYILCYEKRSVGSREVMVLPIYCAELTGSDEAMSRLPQRILEQSGELNFARWCLQSEILSGELYLPSGNMPVHASVVKVAEHLTSKQKDTSYATRRMTERELQEDMPLPPEAARG